MPVISRAAEVACSPEDIFDLVNDIEAYPEFIDMCRAAQVHERRGDTVEAELTAGAFGYSGSFATRNTLYYPRKVEMRLLQGPFEELVGVWRFDPLEKGMTRVSLTVDYEFSDKRLGWVVNPILKQVANRLVKVFSHRMMEKKRAG